MKKILCLIILCWTAMVGAAAANAADDVEVLLDSLDAMIAREGEYVAQKEKRIEELRGRIRRGSSVEEQYTMNSLLYYEYYVYDADTALNLAKKNLAIAEQLGKRDLKVEWDINISFVYAATGMLPQAVEQLQDINANELPVALRVELFRQYIYIYSHYGQYAGESEEAQEYYKLESAYKDSICNLTSPDDPLFLWQKAWGPNPDEVKDALIKVIDGSKMDSRIDAMNAYCLSHIYEWEGNMTERVKYMILSAMADLRCCNRDISAMEELAKWLFSQGDIDHSYTFINYCMQNDRLYHNRVHMISLSEVNNDIHNAYMKRSAEQQQRLHYAMVALIVLIAALIVMVLMVLKQMKKLRLSRAEVSEANENLKQSNTDLMQARSNLSDANARLSELNSKLTDVNAQLKVANTNLRDTNYVKEEIIGYVFSICSQYISRQEDFRKRILRQLKTGQHDEAMKTVAKPLQQSELKEFYSTFDQVFLNIYPDFVQDFNALLRPEERIILKEGELLNTELRIYALVRLGINDSVKISEFLHCSAQTVYNNRLRCRNKAIIPKEEFARTVQSLGKAEILR